MGFRCAIIGLLTVFSADDLGRPDFARDVRPILSENCFACHGPDTAKRQVGLRLDVREDAIARLEESGNVAIVPGKPGASELVKRICSQHNDVMPPKESFKRLTHEQQQTLVRWIETGAEYRPHWACVTPIRPRLPVVRDASWPRGPLDRFIVTRFPADVVPSREADRPTLLYRVTFNLTGLPPSLDEVDAFESDLNPDVFERAVDRLLASPRYGEHMTCDWLDQARNADTHDYFNDHERFMWTWRDWVIDAFNRNLPFDQFTIEQLAGDLLPEATLP